jgi:hypothetical protein
MDGCMTWIVQPYRDAHRRLERGDASERKDRTLITLCGRLLQCDANALDEQKPGKTVQNPPSSLEGDL